MIEATGLTKRLGGRVVVDDVSFRCEPGTVTGFLGPNGAGKTTTMRMLVGLSAPDAGSSAIFEQPYGTLANPGRRPPAPPAPAPLPPAAPEPPRVPPPADGEQPTDVMHRVDEHEHAG